MQELNQKQINSPFTSSEQSVSNETPSSIPEDMQNTPPAIEPPKSSITHRIVITVLIILLLVTGGIATYFYFQTQQSSQSKNTDQTSMTVTPTPDPTEGWQTYSNSSAKYHIKHPPNWQVVNYGTMEAEAATPETKYVRILSQPNVSESAISLEIEEVAEIPPFQERKLNEIITIGSELAKCWTTEDKMTTFCWLSVPEIQKYLNFHISYYENPEDMESISKILSTFEFTSEENADTSTLETTTANDNTTWNKFTSSEYSFSFKYPSYTKANQIHSKYINLIGATENKSIVMPILIVENTYNLSLHDFYIDYLGISVSKAELETHLYFENSISVGNKIGLKVIQDSGYFSQQPTPFTNYLVEIGQNLVMIIKTGEYKGSFDGVKTTVSHTDPNLSDYRKIINSFIF